MRGWMDKMDEWIDGWRCDELAVEIGSPHLTLQWRWPTSKAPGQLRAEFTASGNPKLRHQGIGRPEKSRLLATWRKLIQSTDGEMVETP